MSFDESRKALERIRISARALQEWRPASDGGALRGWRPPSAIDEPLPRSGSGPVAGAPPRDDVVSGRARAKTGEPLVRLPVSPSPPGHSDEARRDYGRAAADPPSFAPPPFGPGPAIVAGLTSAAADRVLERFDIPSSVRPPADVEAAKPLAGTPARSPTRSRIARCLVLALTLIPAGDSTRPPAATEVDSVQPDLLEMPWLTEGQARP